MAFGALASSVLVPFGPAADSLIVGEFSEKKSPPGLPEMFV